MLGRVALVRTTPEDTILRYTYSFQFQNIPSTEDINDISAGFGLHVSKRAKCFSLEVTRKDIMFY
jgi:hypothetical protein